MLQGFRIDRKARRRGLALFLGFLAAGAATAAIAEGACSAPQQAMQQIELMFGRNIGGRLGVSETAWSRFLAREVTPRFPDGLTVYETTGQWRDPQRNVIVRERSRMLRIIIPADAPARDKIEALATAYKKQFSQRSVGIVTRPACASF